MGCLFEDVWGEVEGEIEEGVVGEGGVGGGGWGGAVGVSGGGDKGVLF